MWDHVRAHTLGPATSVQGETTGMSTQDRGCFEPNLTTSDQREYFIYLDLTG